jgi:RNA polymerase sigma factor (sigma-70 family)
MGLTRKLHRLAITQMTHYQEQIRKLKTMKKDIEQAVKGMPSPYREAIQCRYIEGMTIDATARKLHYAPTTIRRHIERGIQILEG